MNVGMNVGDLRHKCSACTSWQLVFMHFSIPPKGLSPVFSAKSTPPLASWEGGSAGPDGILQRHDFGIKKNYLAGLAPPPSHEAKGGVDLADNAGDSPLIPPIITKT
ncbi:hypothetical protein C8J57DRAFT_1241234 [Mycena rebaudengoi]|nr:hypothetical protein C8J57DRAFT_1241234 [Mycena rebaudengoi]